MNAIRLATGVGSQPMAQPFLLVLWAFARREMRDAVQSRWFVCATAAFTVLTVAVSFMSLSGVGAQGFAGFGRTSAGLLNLIMLIVPLMALTAGASSVAGERERGTLLYLLAQPVARIQIILGKFLGLGLALATSLALGFGVSAAVLAVRAGGVGVGAYVGLVLATFLLSLAMLAVGLWISVASRRTAVATGLSLFVWLLLVFVSDLGIMAGTILFKLRVQEVFGLAVVNPLQAFKMGVIVKMNSSLDVLGPSGSFASETFGQSLGAWLSAVLVLWVIVPLGLAAVGFVRKATW